MAGHRLRSAAPKLVKGCGQRDVRLLRYGYQNHEAPGFAGHVADIRDRKTIY
jgi:hypothetical protein